GEEVVVGIRPENLSATGATGEQRSLRGVVTVRESLGSDVYARFALPGTQRLPASLHRFALDAEEAEQAEETGPREAVLIARLPSASAVERHQQIVVT